ncbi:Retrovirus-related Pol polyprotein from transposon TNT 1-94 [Cucumis melo var. makuwa]|uniref:Retrovirus-related Pol polyprotein from transposon TNT 1-94 n=1 Tax=Cucumis melo var. makuwa TaxID=1194695 RepID=A0A5A7TJF1_CUCMM|nr:Retrovirus-related Pol polyprotein from transposon TNT 1-94 [Cucumis melo var. makuwa]TYK05358.1 Retrovirus-related Pol polyprotein from transposon TNT 1-94 [Cucumis melo var. makuwa]
MPGKSSMNGVAERRNRTIKNIVRSMISHSSLSESLWGEALKTATYILNRTGNAKFLEDVEFEGEDNIKKVVFEKELISLLDVGIDDVQTPIPEFTMEPILEQDNNEVRANSTISRNAIKEIH